MGDVITDADLVRSLREQGNVMAFEALVKRHQGPLFGFILRQLGDKARAEDVFQQTLLRVFDKIDSCKSPEAFKPWAFSVASNLCRNEERSQRSRPGFESLERADHRAAPGLDPEAAAAAAEARRTLQLSLSALPAAQREVFVLYHFTQLSYDEIAAATGMPLGTVKSRMNAALIQLRQTLVGTKDP